MATTKGSSTSKKKATSNKSAATRKVNSSISKKLSDASGIDKKVISKGVSKVNRLSIKGKIAVTLSLLIGIGIGYFGVKLIERNDQFRLLNGNNVTINVGDSFDIEDLSKQVICVSYGMNALKSVEVEVLNNKTIDNTKEDSYEIVYRSSNIKYRNIELHQVVTYVNSEDSYNDAE